MTELHPKPNDAQTEMTAEIDLADLVSRLTDRLRQGDRLDESLLQREYPQQATSLKELLPTLRAMIDIEGGEDDRGADIHGADRLFRKGLVLGDFQLVREIGRGGMGIVYEAMQTSLSRQVALKLLPLAGVLDQRQLTRFQNEARAAASLHHPNIVPVFFVGKERGIHFYVMQLIEGQSLAEVLEDLRTANAADRSSPSSVVEQIGTVDWSDFSRDESQAGEARAGSTSSTPELPTRSQKNTVRDLQAAISTERAGSHTTYFRNLAHVMQRVAEAVDYAHGWGITHRDLKPANIMLDADGCPWVTDFGLARLEGDAGMTMTGDLVGTMRYMSPEQALANRGMVDHRSDVYSLGVTLYELATLVPAVTGESRQEVLEFIAFRDPVAPRRIDRNIPQELETIILKAIEKRPEDRYATAKALAEDLDRFLAYRPLTAKPMTPLGHVKKWLIRHRAIAWTGAIALLLVVITSLVSLLWVMRANRDLLAARDSARATADRLDDALVQEKSATALAEENFELALAAVDDMYRELATNWMEDSSSPTMFQQRFLQRARDFYVRVGRQQSNVKDQARITERIGQLDFYLENYDGADLAFEFSIELTEALRQSEPDNTAWVSDLARRYRRHAQALKQMADVKAAAASYETALERLAELEQHASLTVEHRLEQIQIQNGLASVHLQQSELDQAETLLRAAREQIQETFKLIRETQEQPILPSELFVAEMHNGYLLARWHLANKMFSAAENEATTALEKYRNILDALVEETRSATEIENRILDLLGAISEAEGDLQQAAKQYQASLETQRNGLQSQKEPSQFIVTTRFMGRKGLLEHSPFCDYIETQQRLARVLLALDRPYEAEYRLGQCMLAMLVIAEERPAALRYHVTQANTWALAAQVIRPRRPKEAKKVFAHAFVLWQRTLDRFEYSENYCSGVHGSLHDLQWFRSLLSEAQLAKLDAEAESSPDDGKFLEPPTIAFRRDATGRSWLDAGQFEMAVRSLEHSVELREADRTYAWLLLAMAYSKNGQASEAAKYFRMAGDEIRTSEDRSRELIDLAREVAQVLKR